MYYPHTHTGFGLGTNAFGLALCIVVFVALIKVFQKAGRQWWELIIPIYNMYVFIKIAGKPGWWILLHFVPIVNIVVFIIVTHNLSKSFGKDGGFTLGLLFLPFIFYPILGFGDASYIKNQTANASV